MPGRFEVLADGAGGELVLDGAHNAGGIAALVESLPAFLAGRPLVAVVSVLDDKDARAMLEGLLALCSGVVFTASANPRAIAAGRLAELAGELRAGRRARRRGRPAPRARDRAGARGPARRRARDRLDLPRRRPQAPRRRRTRIDAVSEKGPSAFALIAAVAIIVALVILVFFAIGYGLGRILL